MDEQALNFEPIFGAFIIETLTVGMYEVPRLALREYIQNAFDSTREAVRLGLIGEDEALIEVTLNTDDQEVIIRDNGMGLPAHSAIRTLTSIGASTKTYRSQAGFRGIGRLAGIAFADKVKFTTKFRNNPEITEVTFNGDQMRDLMAPAKENSLSAQDLLKKTVVTRKVAAGADDDHFFEVRLSGFDDPPRECLSAADMKAFLAQVAPVDYGPEFPFREEIRAAAEIAGMPIETVRITVRAGTGDAENVYKPYGPLYAYQGKLPEPAADQPALAEQPAAVAAPENPNADVVIEFEGERIPQTRLTRIDTYVSESKRWFMWVGKKAKSGAFVEPSPWGIRVRVKNIQIDGTELMADVFGSESASNKRFNQWSVGEVFIKADALVPNARRDGFEQDQAWKEIKHELFIECKKLAREIRELSSSAQLSLDKLKTDFTKHQNSVESLKDFEGRQKVERAIACAANLEGLQAKIQKSRNAAVPADQGEFQTLFDQTKTLRTRAVAMISGEQADIEVRLQEARDELIMELMDEFKNQLGPDCLGAVRQIVAEKFGVSSDDG